MKRTIRTKTISAIRKNITNHKDQLIYAHVDPVSGLIVYIGIGILNRPTDFDRTHTEHIEFLSTYQNECVYVLNLPLLTKAEARKIETDLIRQFNPLFNDQERTTKEAGMHSIDELRKQFKVKTMKEVGQPNAPATKDPAHKETPKLSIAERLRLDYTDLTRKWVKAKHLFTCKEVIDSVVGCKPDYVPTNDVQSHFEASVLNELVKEGVIGRYKLLPTPLVSTSQIAAPNPHPCIYYKVF